MRGAIPALTHTSSWRGTLLSTGTSLPFTVFWYSMSARKFEFHYASNITSALHKALVLFSQKLLVVLQKLINGITQPH
jgi:hypothetical protein